MSDPIIVVYTPPEAGLPYLAVSIDPGGKVSATCHKTFDEAEAAVVKTTANVHKELGSD